MTTLTPEGQVEPTNLGLSRRRILQGIAWAAPAVVVATAVPAAAASLAPAPASGVGSLPAGTGLTIGSLNATYEPTRWNSTVSATIKAVNSGAYIQNSGNTVPTSQSVILTAIFPVGTLTNPRWGIGQGNGIAAGEPWTRASGPSVSGGYATLTLLYTGPALGPWGGISLSNLWMESSGNVAGQNVTLTVNATYQGNYTSTASKSDPA